MQSLKPFKYYIVLAIGAVSLLTTNAQDGVYSVATIADLVKLNPSTYKNVYVRGRNSAGDGGEGLFYNLTTTTTTNMGTVFAGTGAYSNRRWFRNFSGAADIKWWGLDGSINDQAKLVNAFNTVDVVYFSKGTYRVSADLDIQRSEKIIMERGALFSIDAGKTMTVRCTVDAGFYPIFSGAGNVTFSTFPQVDRVPVTWFGADPTYGVDSTTAFTKALSSAVSSMPTRVYVPAGQYKVTSTLTIPNRITIEGESLSSAIYFTPNVNDSFLFSLVSGSDNVKIRGLSLVNFPKAGITGTSAINAPLAVETFIDDVFLESFEKYGLFLDRALYVKLNRVRIMRTKNKVNNVYYGTAIYMNTYVAGLSMRECRVNANDIAMKADRVNGANIEACYFEVNGENAPGAKNTIYINDCKGISFTGNYFEGNFTGPGATDALMSFNYCRGVNVTGCSMWGDYASKTNTQNFINISGNSTAVIVSGNYMGAPVSKFIVVDSTSTTVEAHKNAYSLGLDKTPVTRYDDIAARMSAEKVDIDVPSAFTWTPGLLPNGEIIAATLNVPGAKKGRRDQVMTHFDNLGANDLVLTGYVQNDGQVRVLLENRSGINLNIAAGTLSIRLQKMD